MNLVLSNRPHLYLHVNNPLWGYTLVSHCMTQVYTLSWYFSTVITTNWYSDHLAMIKQLPSCLLGDLKHQKHRKLNERGYYSFTRWTTFHIFVNFYCTIITICHVEKIIMHNLRKHQSIKLNMSFIVIWIIYAWSYNWKTKLIQHYQFSRVVMLFCKNFLKHMIHRPLILVIKQSGKE